MTGYKDRWVIAKAASIALQDVIDNPEKYNIDDFDKYTIYHWLNRWFSRFPGPHRLICPDHDAVLRSSVGRD